MSFRNGEKRIYDCSPLLTEEVFHPLKDDSFFRMMKADSGGYGISWTDEVELSESELWLNGMPAEQGHRANGTKQRLPWVA